MEGLKAQSSFCGKSASALKYKIWVMYIESSLIFFMAFVSYSFDYVM